MHRMLAIAAAVVASFVTAAAVGAADTDGVWLNGKRHALATAPPSATTAHPTALYVIAPVDPSAPLHPLADAQTHGFGAHDHVIGASRVGVAMTCDLHLVVPGPKAKLGVDVFARATQTPAGTRPLLYAARLANRVQPLTWSQRIRRAAGRGLARVVDTHTLLSCTVT